MGCCESEFCFWSLSHLVHSLCCPLISAATTVRLPARLLAGARTTTIITQERAQRNESVRWRARKKLTLIVCTHEAVPYVA